MAPRSHLPFPPLSAAGGWTSAQHAGIFTCSSERIVTMLLVAALVWIVGLVAFISQITRMDDDERGEREESSSGDQREGGGEEQWMQLQSMEDAMHGAG